MNDIVNYVNQLPSSLHFFILLTGAVTVSIGCIYVLSRPFKWFADSIVNKIRSWAIIEEGEAEKIAAKLADKLDDLYETDWSQLSDEDADKIASKLASKLRKSKVN